METYETIKGYFNKAVTVLKKLSIHPEMTLVKPLIDSLNAHAENAIRFYDSDKKDYQTKAIHATIKYYNLLYYIEGNKIDTDHVIVEVGALVEVCRRHISEGRPNEIKKEYLTLLHEVAGYNLDKVFEGKDRFKAIIKISVVEYFHHSRFPDEYVEFHSQLPIKDTKVVTEFDTYEDEYGNDGIIRDMI